MGFVFILLPTIYSQDQREVDSLATIYATHNVEGEEKLELFLKFMFNERIESPGLWPQN
jgi:hypothetical protein